MDLGRVPGASGLGQARRAGAEALESVKVGIAERLAELLRRDAQLAATAVEVGIVDRAWLEEPGRHPIRSAPALEVVERFLERSVEQRPSLIGAMGLSTLQMLQAEHPAAAVDATPEPTTVVFTDLEGFTRFTSRTGDQAARDLLTHHHRAVGPVVRSRGGRIVKRLGDGLMLSFTAPEAAVLASLELVELRPPELRLRVGLHTGEAVVVGDDLIGHDVNLAARVADAAKGGQVLATTEVRAAVGDLPGVRFGRARRRSFKGVDGGVSVCPVTRA